MNRDNSRNADVPCQVHLGKGTNIMELKGEISGMKKQ